MNDAIEVSEVFQLLHRWKEGHIDEQQVHMDAELMFEKLQAKIQRPSDDNHASIMYEVLSQLSILNYQLITPEDVLAIARFLETPLGQEHEGWREWRKYWII
jgi:hypothetical protein